MGRNHQYDVIRIIAIFFVVIGHSSYINLHIGLGGVSYAIPANVSSVYYGQLLETVRWMSGWVYGFHMALFFIVSGAVYHSISKRMTFDELVAKKIYRLALPFFFVGLLFMFPIKTISNFYIIESLPRVVNVFLASGAESGHLWFLAALFWVFIIFFGIEKLLKDRTICGILLVCGAIQMYSSVITLDFYNIQDALRNIFWFSFGYFFDSKKQFVHKMRLDVQFAALLLVVAINIKYQSFSSVFNVVTMFYFLYIVSCIILKLVYLPRFWLYKRICSSCMDIYLFHDPLEYIVLKYTFSFGLLANPYYCYLYVFLRVLGVAIVSMFIGVVVGAVVRKLKGYCFSISPRMQTD